MGKRKAPARKSPAKKKKTAPANTVVETENAEKIQKIVDHVKLITERQNVLHQHCTYLENKMREFARLVHRQQKAFEGHLSELQNSVHRLSDDVYRLAPTDMLLDEFLGSDQITCPNSPLSMDGEMMSESELIKVVGEYAQSEP